MDIRQPSQHEQFDFDSWAEIERKLDELGLALPCSENVSVLAGPQQAGPLQLPNALAIHPVEGCDGSSDGRPEPLTFRRYNRFARGGAGLIWMEATAVVHRGRANPRQLWLHRETVGDFARLIDALLAAAADEHGTDYRPVTVAQLTHSGRYSKPDGAAAPVIAYRHPVLDPRHNLPEDYPIISDEELDRLQDAYVAAARFALQAGFDAVDVKACHGYLLYELLNAHTRENSRYGGSYENRTRMVREIVQRIRDEVPGIAIVSRLSVYDAMPYPYGFGMAEDGSMEPDLTEPIRLIEELQELGVCLINVAYGSPYYNPHVERPYDTHEIGGYIPQEHPLVNIATMVDLHRKLAAKVPQMPLVATGFTWLREYSPLVAAALVEAGEAASVGWGRMALAHPGFAREIIEQGALDPTKVCICCSSCTQIMRDGGRSGCVVRDWEVYEPIFREGQARNPVVMRELAKICRDCHAPTCQTGCPAGVNIPGFVTAIADGDERRAYQVLRESNPLPEMCAYVCPAETQCEGACVQRHIGPGPVPIRQLQRYVCEIARREGWTAVEAPAQLRDERVAIIGAGPAGIACAVRLLEQGLSVTIIDAAEQAGGVASETIPVARLAEMAAPDEVACILNGCATGRVEWRLGTRMSADLTVDNLLTEGFDAIFVGVGMSQGIALSGAERPDSGVIEALEFLRKVKSGAITEVPNRVAVLGGGNTAMDAAVTAKELGALDVYLVYRRSFPEMPAWPAERDEALEKGVHFMLLTQPLDYVAEGGRLTGVRVAATSLGEPDASGRRRPIVDEASERVLAVDLAIEAVGQAPPSDLAQWLPGVELTDRGLIAVADGTTRTSRESVYAGGDIVNGGETVVRAVADGVRAADEIARDLTGA
ncbi:MAG: FAD-dependent oxidoreductase [candidate division WS1 bacterium]|jgi:NADPH-dependent glutamate synthase beta subunit-like oxidoreductase/2,4-dienoyl-CoA reductase-like NADH-dependent reductase (Old Yellow Enzyme family)|nr:FAD-dependent oxidoreductase [candidate division WS1 bacterium]